MELCWWSWAKQQCPLRWSWWDDLSMASIQVNLVYEENHCISFSSYYFILSPSLPQVIVNYRLLWKCMISLWTPLGVSLSVHTIYLVECAPKRLRAMVGVTVATFISFGKFSGQLLGIRWGDWRHGYCGESSKGSSVVVSNDSSNVKRMFLQNNDVLSVDV